MEKVYILLFILLGSVLIQAQPVLTESIIPNIGDNASIKYLTPMTFSPGDGGENKTWDYSDLDQSLLTDLTFQIIDPTSVLGHGDFPDADFVWYIQGFEVYEFYAHNQDSLFLIGGVSISNNAINFQTNFVDYEDVFQFPMEYGDNYDYTSEFDQYLFGNLLNSEIRTGNVNIDGYGTLITPHGTFEDVLRIIITETSFGITNTQYAWISPNSFIPLMVYETSDDPYEPTSVYYSELDFNSTSIENVKKELDWKVWFNSPENKIQVQLPELVDSKTIQLQVSDILGKEIITRTLQNSEVSETLLSVELEQQLPTQIFLITLNIEGQLFTKKVFVGK